MNNILLAFLLTNAIFWGLFPHSSHCQLVSSFNKMLSMKLKCFQHWIHLLSGIVFFVLAVYIAQKKYVDKMLF